MNPGKLPKERISIWKKDRPIRRRIKPSPLNITDLALLTGYTKSHISGVCKGRTVASEECLAKIQEVIQVARDGKLEEWMKERGILAEAN